MYCVKCGVELSDSEKFCPLCNTEVICPNEARSNEPCPYPPYPGAVVEGPSKFGILFIITIIFSLPFLLCLLCDFKINGEIIWSGYASGAILMLYSFLVFPFWFRKPNPVIFVPIDFIVLGCYLLYISCVTNGGWFLSFAFPTVGGIMLITTAVVALMKYTKGKGLFIIGAATVLYGCFLMLVEFFLYITFSELKMFKWSLYPMSALSVIGIMLIVIGICRPFRESLKRKLFF